MKSKTFVVLFLFLLLFFSSNAFAEYNTILAGAVAKEDKPYPQKDIIFNYPNTTGEMISSNDPLTLYIILQDYSLNSSGGKIDPDSFTIRIDRKGLVSSSDDRYVEFTYNSGITSVSGGATVTALNSGNFEDNWDTLSFNIEFLASITNFNGKSVEIKNIPIWIQYDGTGDFYPLYYMSRPGWIYHLNVKTFQGLPPSVPDPLADLNVFLAPITCYNTATESPVFPVPVDGDGVIRCDDASGFGVSSDTIYYEVMIEDINSDHTPAETGHKVKVDAINLVCSTDPVGFGKSRREMHYSHLGSISSGIQYYGFPPTCDFMYFANGIQPGHTDCIIDIYNGSSAEEYSVPTDYSTALSSCDGDGDCIQDNNVYYNSNYFWLKRYVNPSEFTLESGDQKVFKGTVSNNATGGNFKCQGWIEYSLYDSGNNKINSFTQEMIVNSTNTESPAYNDGSREIMVWNENTDFYKTIKLEGHESYLENPALSTPFVRPFSDIRLESDIVNTGKPWDGSALENFVYVDMTIYDEEGDALDTITYSIPSLYYGSIDTGDSLWIYHDFPVDAVTYQTYKTADYAEITLYGFRDGYQWFYDYEDSFRFLESRLIAILDPAAFEEHGSDCYTDESIEEECWWSAISYDVMQVDVNSNSMPEFILRLKNPLDDSENFDLSFDSNKVLGKALLEFDPERNLIPGFDYASSPNRFGVKYAKMILTNPRILSGDSNYLIKTTSVNYPFIWDNVWIKFTTNAHNLKAESLRLDPEKDGYYLSDPPIKFTFGIRNTGSRIERNIQFRLVSSMDSSVVFTAPANTKIDPGQIIYFTGILPVIPSKDVFVVEATVEPVAFEYDFSDNSISKVITVKYSGDLSLPETNYVFILLIIVLVLFVVRKK